MTYEAPENEAREFLACVEREVAALERKPERDAREEARLRNLKRERGRWRATVRRHELRDGSRRR